MELKKEDLKILEKITEEFMRKILKTSKTCPIIAMYSHLGFWLPENKIMESKLRFLYHLEHVGEKAVSFRVLQEQKRLKMKGLYQECRKFMSMLNLREKI